LRSLALGGGARAWRRSLKSLALGGRAGAWTRAAKVWSLEPERDPRETQVSLFLFLISSSCLQWTKNKKKVTADWLPSPSSSSSFLAALQRSEEGDGSNGCRRLLLLFYLLQRCSAAKKATSNAAAGAGRRGKEEARLTSCPLWTPHPACCLQISTKCRIQQQEVHGLSWEVATSVWN